MTYATLADRRLRDLVVAIQAGQVAQVSVFAERLVADPGSMPSWPADVPITTLRYAYLLGRLSMAVDLGMDALYRTTLRALATQCRAAA